MYNISVNCPFPVPNHLKAIPDFVAECSGNIEFPDLAFDVHRDMVRENYELSHGNIFLLTVELRTQGCRDPLPLLL
jgi:hypothetical protein